MIYSEVLAKVQREGSGKPVVWIRAALDLGWGTRLGATAPGEGTGACNGEGWHKPFCIHTSSSERRRKPSLVFGKEGAGVCWQNLRVAPGGKLSGFTLLAGTVGLSCWQQPCMGDTCVGLCLLPTSHV